MITVKPPKETYHCHCECGAEFFAFKNDITQYDIVIIDKYAGYRNSYDEYPSMLDSIKCDIIKCPFCDNFVLIKDNGYNIEYKDLRLDSDKNIFNKVSYKIENTDEIPVMEEKYPQLLKDRLYKIPRMYDEL